MQTIAAGLSIYLLNYIGQKIVAGLRERLWKKVLILPVSYYDQNRTGDTISRMTNDTGVVKTLISEHLSNLLTGGNFNCRIINRIICFRLENDTFTFNGYSIISTDLSSTRTKNV